MSSPSWFTTTASRQVYDGFSRVRVDTLQTPSGKEIEREVVERLGAVAVVPVDTEGRVLLLRQYRHPIGGYVLEIPAGLLDVEDEAPEHAARRELAEEIAYDVDELLPLTAFLNSAGWCTERTHVFLGRDCRPGEMPEGFVPDSEEADMEIVPLSIEDALDAARTGVITDAKTVIGLLLAEPHLR